jgi:hypothetical protein
MVLASVYRQGLWYHSNQHRVEYSEKLLQAEPEYSTPRDLMYVLQAMSSVTHSAAMASKSLRVPIRRRLFVSPMDRGALLILQIKCELFGDGKRPFRRKHEYRLCCSVGPEFIVTYSLNCQ